VHATRVAAEYPALLEQLAAAQAILPLPSTITSPARGPDGMRSVDCSTSPELPCFTRKQLAASFNGVPTGASVPASWLPPGFEPLEALPHPASSTSEAPNPRNFMAPEA